MADDATTPGGIGGLGSLVYIYGALKCSQYDKYYVLLLECFDLLLAYCQLLNQHVIFARIFPVCWSAPLVNLLIFTCKYKELREVQVKLYNQNIKAMTPTNVGFT